MSTNTDHFSSTNRQSILICSIMQNRHSSLPQHHHTVFHTIKHRHVNEQSLTCYVGVMTRCCHTWRHCLSHLFSPFLTISLCRAGQYLSHPVFSVLCHVFSQSVFLHVSLYVVPPSLSRSASAPSPRDL